MTKAHRLPLVAAGLTIAAAGGFVAVPAVAQDSSSTLTARGGTTMRPNHSTLDTQRFTPGSVTIAPNGTLTLRDRTTNGEPHTLSVVKATQLPKRASQVGRCFQGGPCAQLEQAHTGGEEPEGPPKNPVVNVGKAGLDQPGDSVFFMKDAGPTKIKVSAARGANLRFMCIIHPQMQGTIKVR